MSTRASSPPTAEGRTSRGWIPDGRELSASAQSADYNGDRLSAVCDYPPGPHAVRHVRWQSPYRPVPGRRDSAAVRRRLLCRSRERMLRDVFAAQRVPVRWPSGPVRRRRNHQCVRMLPAGRFAASLSMRNRRERANLARSLPARLRARFRNWMLQAAASAHVPCGRDSATVRSRLRDRSANWMLCADAGRGVLCLPEGTARARGRAPGTAQHLLFDGRKLLAERRGFARCDEPVRWQVRRQSNRSFPTRDRCSSCRNSSNLSRRLVTRLRRVTIQSEPRLCPDRLPPTVAIRRSSQDRRAAQDSISPASRPKLSGYSPRSSLNFLHSSPARARAHPLLPVHRARALPNLESARRNVRARLDFRSTPARANASRKLRLQELQVLHEPLRLLLGRSKAMRSSAADTPADRRQPDRRADPKFAGGRASRIGSLSGFNLDSEHRSADRQNIRVSGPAALGFLTRRSDRDRDAAGGSSDLRADRGHSARARSSDRKRCGRRSETEIVRMSNPPEPWSDYLYG